MLSGATAVLPRVKMIQAEISLTPIYENMPNWIDCLTRYQAAGFTLLGLFPAVQDKAGMPIEFDCLMYRLD